MPTMDGKHKTKDGTQSEVLQRPQVRSNDDVDVHLRRGLHPQHQLLGSFWHFNAWQARQIVVPCNALPQLPVFSDGVARDKLIARARLLLQGRILPRDVGRLGPRTGQEVLQDLELVVQ